MFGELGKLASWFKGDCVAPEEFSGLAVTEKVIRTYCYYFGKKFNVNH